MYKIVSFNDKSIKFAKITRNDIKFVSLKTILKNKDAFYTSSSQYIENLFLKIILAKLPFKHKVDFKIWHKKNENSPTVLQSLEYLVVNGYVSANIKGTKLN